MVESIFLAPMAAPFRLIHLNDDEIEVIFGALADSVAPHVAVALASTCRGLRVPTEVALAELRRRHEAVKALCAKECHGTKWSELRVVEMLAWYNTGLAAADMVVAGVPSKAFCVKARASAQTPRLPTDRAPDWRLPRVEAGGG